MLFCRGKTVTPSSFWFPASRKPLYSTVGAVDCPSSCLLRWRMRIAGANTLSSNLQNKYQLLQQYVYNMHALGSRSLKTYLRNAVLMVFYKLFSLLYQIRKSRTVALCSSFCWILTQLNYTVYRIQIHS